MSFHLSYLSHWRIVITGLCLTILFLCVHLEGRAAHISGGELYYRYLGAGTTPGTSRYEISLRLFRDCNPIAGGGGTQTADLPTLVVLGIFRNGSNTPYLDSLPVSRTDFAELNLLNPGACIQNAPPVCYQIGTYTQIVELPINDEGYTISFQSCCRANGLSNISGVNAGATYLANIPGSLAVGTRYNSSPVFDIRDTILVCRNRKFTLPFSATDPDGDSLSYRFCEAYNSIGITNAAIRKPFAPPYTPMNYQNNFSGVNPLGNNVSILPQNGLIEGIAPDGIVNPIGLSYFVVNVCVTEWRNGTPISEHRKDFIIRISPCQIAQATLNIDERGCDTYTKTFANLTNSSLIQTWFWDFGIPGITNDTSILPSPTFTFPDTGTYKIKLIINKQSFCADSASSTYFIYPGFFPDMKFSPGCKNAPVQFEDATRSNYGKPNYWFWDFGVNNSLADTSILKNPQYTYNTIGNYNVNLIVGSDKGCLDTITKTISITDKPALNITNDTTICINDRLQLTGTGTGTWTWSPNISINNVNISNPVVSPDTTTTYYATLTSGPGCTNIDSLKVVVKKFVLLLPLRDTTICLGDTLQLNPESDGLRFNWTPAGPFINPTEKNTKLIAPSGTNDFKLTATIGSCSNSVDLRVTTVPYPTLNAGNDTSICYNSNAILRGSGNANNWIWRPSGDLSAPTQLITNAKPLSTQAYILTGTSNNGCPKPVSDTVLIRVVPQVLANAGNDTSVIVGQPLQLNASGGNIYAWLPSSFLNNPNISNPVTIFNDPKDAFSYVVKVSTPEGCFAFDTIQIKVFKVQPGFLVPTAFSPDNNSLNDVFRPIPTGITQFDFFKIYNRWGNEIFSTNIAGKGWDGTYKGAPQEPGVYVWIVQGIDFTGKKHFQKGTVTLIK
jgi:gliding motility-associated-like protein